MFFYFPKSFLEKKTIQCMWDEMLRSFFRKNKIWNVCETKMFNVFFILENKMFFYFPKSFWGKEKINYTMHVRQNVNIIF